ncbi:MAG: glutamine-hydrolyzing GMP synthase [Candidatus Peregrinibacteria bacterium]
MALFVFDFGGQYAHLIANRVRRCKAYSEIVPNDISAEELQKRNPSGIIFSGGPHSVFEENSPQIDPQILELGIPILGICYGHQIIARTLGGKVEAGKVHEFGKADFFPTGESKLFEHLPSSLSMWMSHGDQVTVLPEGFQTIGTTKDCGIAAMEHSEKRIFGVQFHPEVTHSLHGMEVLENFVALCEKGQEWSLENFVEEETQKIQKKCEGKKVFLLVSGGVDSSVCFALLEKALGKDRVFGCLIDHGLMRKNEASEVKAMLAKAGFEGLHIENAQEFFLEKLHGVAEPEAKRKIIGDAFLEVQNIVSERLQLNPEEWLLAQGTIYPDTIESGGTKHASKIKTHHNRVKKITEMIESGKIIEPMVELYKDEVRAVGRILGLPEELIARHPFPGPGLGVRILCAKEENTLEDSAAIEKNIAENFQNDLISDAKILPIKSVGVQGDGRSYRHPCVLKMNRQEKTLPETEKWQQLEVLTSQIPNHFPVLNRVLLLISGNLEDMTFQPRPQITKDRITTLQEADAVVRNFCFENQKITQNIWQFPVVLAPVGGDEKESIILRPIESENAMTANAAHLPFEFLEKMAEEIIKKCGNKISHIFYDLTSKPPGTIEWE